MPDLSDTLRKCRIGTAKNFTLLLLLYHTQAKSQGMKQLMAGGGVALILKYTAAPSPDRGRRGKGCAAF